MDGELPFPIRYQGRPGETHEEMERRLGITFNGSFVLTSPLDDEGE